MISISKNEFIELAKYMKTNYGINLFEKANLIEGRLQNELISNGFSNFSEYFKHVKSDMTGLAITTLINKLTTNHTFFMREAEHFSYFKDKILPYLESKYSTKRDLRIWSAGCSSGEEPYTLAMIISDYFGDQKRNWDTKILATDISHKVLETAVNGLYSNDQILSLPSTWKLNYIKRIDSQKSAVADAIKTEVIFRHFNLMNEIFPFKNKFHVIFCRNVMIYFDNETKTKLLNKFYDLTDPGGYLFIGHSETINSGSTNYKYVMPSVYRKE